MARASHGFINAYDLATGNFRGTVRDMKLLPFRCSWAGLGGVNGAFAELANPEQHAKVMVEPWS
jgi:hypothetical protein